MIHSFLKFKALLNLRHYLHGGEDVVCKRKLSVDEFLLFIFKGVAIVDVQLAFSSVLSSNWKTQLK